MDTIEKINHLKAERNAVILAHNYQRAEVQDIADYVGDSLGLSIQAAKLDADVIVFCGVDFMAESAAILSPDKTVLIPDAAAQCPMAAMITADALRKAKQDYAVAKGDSPDSDDSHNSNLAVVCYVNSSAEVKAECDICCTSSNAVAVVESLPQHDVLFVPDINLANYVASKTDKNIIAWEGFCPTHHQILKGDILLAKMEHPDAVVLAHPECRSEVIEVSDHAFSTDGILRYVRDSDKKEFIIGTESGIIHRLQKENPDKIFYAANEYAICPNMKMTTLEGVLHSLETMEHVVTVPKDVRKKAKLALDRMLMVGRKE